MEYTVLIHTAEEGGYWVEVPALPGCFSQGETLDEALANIQEAIELHVESLREEGQDIPQDRGFVIGRVEVSEVPWGLVTAGPAKRPSMILLDLKDLYGETAKLSLLLEYLEKAMDLAAQATR
jgi:predicted RNase H-like HicB family nuclease